MIFKNARYKMSVFILLSTFVFGCAGPKSNANLSSYNDHYITKFNQSGTAISGKKNQSLNVVMTPFQELVVSLVLDSLELVPKIISDEYCDAILKGIEIPDLYDEIDRSVLSSQRKEDIAFVTGIIVQQVYAKGLKTETIKPQSIVYLFKDKVVYTDLAEAASKLDLSQNYYLDAYNVSLNFLVNLLLSNNQIKQKSNNGLYVRDANNNLYFQQKL